MASILPNQIPSIAVEVLDDGGKFEKNWWLFFYNIAQSVLGNTGTTSAAFAAQINADLDADVDQTDSLGLVTRVTNLEKQLYEALPDPIDGRALLLAQDDLLPDPTPRAQPVSVLTPGGSPWTYIAPFDGLVVISAGTVSAIALSRDGSTFYVTGLTSGLVPVSKLDQVKTSYTGVPTMTFFPR